MAQEKNNTTLILNIIITLLLIALVTVSAYRKMPVDDPGEYDTCVEWQGGIGLDNLITKLYDFREGKIIREYYIEGPMDLVFHEPGNEDNIEVRLKCVRFAKTITVTPIGDVVEDAVALP
jgi:hypothetical protein